MRWIRVKNGGYVSENQQLWIHRFWADYGYKTATQNWWTLCVASPSGWDVVDDVSSFMAAKKLAEQSTGEEK